MSFQAFKINKSKGAKRAGFSSSSDVEDEAMPGPSGRRSSLTAAQLQVGAGMSAISLPPPAACRHRLSATAACRRPAIKRLLPASGQRP